MNSHQKSILITGIWEILIGLGYLLLAIRANESNAFRYRIFWAALMLLLGVTLIWLTRKNINKKRPKLGITVLLLLPIAQTLFLPAGYLDMALLK